MMKTLSKKWGRYILLFALLVLTACERDDAIEEVQSVDSNKAVFFASYSELSEYEKSLLADVQLLVTDSITESWIRDYGNPVWQKRELLHSETEGNLLLVPLLKENLCTSLLCIKQKSEELLVKIIPKKCFLDLEEDNPAFLQFLKMVFGQKNIGDYKYEFIEPSKTETTTRYSVIIERCMTVIKYIVDGETGETEEVSRYTICSHEVITMLTALPIYYGGTGGGGGGGGGGGSYTPPEPEVNDDNLEDTKADCIKEALEAGGSNSLLNKLLAGFKLENSPIDIIYKVQDKVFGKKGDEVNGLCRHNPNTNQITIFLSKTRMQTQSFLETARTILHETFHAHLYGMINAEDNTAFNTVPDADGLDFSTTWGEYIKLHPKQKQHNWMAEKYIGLMKEGLSKLYEQWDDADRSRFEAYAGVTNANRDFMFESIAWHGLLGKNHDMTEAGKEFYAKKGAEYEKMKEEVIRYLGRNCPSEK